MSVRCINIFINLVIFLAIPPSGHSTSPELYSHKCKAVPGSEGWPSRDEWSKLNKDLEGHLLTASSPALVCDPSHPKTYNKAQCAIIGDQWGNGTFHTDDPVSVHFPNFQDDACLPTAIYNKSTKCDVTPFPRYVVNATKASDVQTAIKFASDMGVRLSVKGTGHDFLGRSTGPGLSIWTHHIRGLKVHSSFKPNGCGSCQGAYAMTVSAGHILADIYSEAKKHNVIVSAGAEPGVGIGGYLIGGGHGPISVKYGLAVDNVLEMVVVTPDGKVVTTNEYQNPDLFWAMKGGGGSTFGVLMSATLRTFPDFPISKFNIVFYSTPKEASKNNNSDWYSATAIFHRLIPALTDSNITAYYSFGTQSLIPVGGNGSKSGQEEPMVFAGAGWGLNISKNALNRQLAPLKEKLDAEKTIVSNLTTTSAESIYDVVGTATDDTSISSGFNAIMGSRLWDKAAVTDEKSLTKTFRSIQSYVFQGLMISGPGVRDKAKAKTISLTPTWRDTYLHTTIGNTFDFRNKTAKRIETRLNTYVTTASLRHQAPNMGCYVNEADIHEPNHQQAFWGSNYKRLLKIKQKYDPKGVFWCSICVGAENWKLDKATGQICPVA